MVVGTVYELIITRLEVKRIECTCSSDYGIRLEIAQLVEQDRKSVS